VVQASESELAAHAAMLQRIREEQGVEPLF